MPASRRPGRTTYSTGSRRLSRACPGTRTAGATRRELLDIGVRECREVFFKPYRTIYRVIGETVYVLVIADGRRDMRSLLERRLLEG